MAWLTCVGVMAFTGSAAQNIDGMLSQADGLFKQGMTEDAKLVYEKIARLDTTCHTSTVWLGNYYFLKGEEKRKQVERAYHTLPNPNRMQSANYQEQLKAVCQAYYLKADTLVKRALRQQQNDQLLSIASSIEAYKIRLGLAKPSVKKKPPVIKLFRSFRDSTALL